MEIICEKCGTECLAENVKSYHWVAWCDVCRNYAQTDRDLDRERMEDLMDAAELEIER